MVFATDHEHTEVPDPALADFARSADLLYIDAHYLQAEYDGAIGIGKGVPASHHGWGHSTIEAAVATAAAAGVHLLHLGHHEPARDDAELHWIEQLAERLLTEALRTAGRPTDSCRVQLAREELVIEI
jgi:ribonuclease BN (tRNA processing enzyme)